MKDKKEEEILDDMKEDIGNAPQVKLKPICANQQNTIYRRFLFNTRKQQLGESLNDFASSLKILSNGCDYDADEVLIHSLIRDRFIAGLRQSTIQLEVINQSNHVAIHEEHPDNATSKEKLDNLSLGDAVKLAYSIEQRLASQNEIKLENDSSVFQSCNNIISQDVGVTDNPTNGVLPISQCPIMSNNENKGIDIDQSLKPKEEINIVEKDVEPDSENQNTVSTNISRPSKIPKRKNVGKVYHCKHCSECFSNKKILGRHLKKYHLEEEKFSCKSCDEVFANKVRLQKHTNTVHEQKGIVCQLCQNCYKSQACLKAHVRVKHETGGEKVCLICFQVLADDKDLKEHTTEQHNDGGMICSICNKQLRMDESLRFHIKKKHSEDGKTICPYCGKLFALIEQHIAKDHSIEEWRKCEQCDFTGSKHMIQCHMYYYHPKGPELICDTCGYRTPHNSVLKQHIRMVHQKIKPYSCVKCHRSFFSESRLKDHDAVFHKNQLFSCEKCHKSYKIRRQLQVHIRSIHQGIWVHCPQCNLKFAENHDLKRHKKHVHDRNYSFNCEHCGRGFPFSTRLKEHIQKHHTILVC